MDIASQFPSLETLPPVAVPFLVFFARIVDVSLGTLRIVLVARGMRLASAVLGFFELLIWLIAISQVLQHLHNVVSVLAYCAGFAIGTYIGVTIERYLTFGHCIIRFIIPQDGSSVMDLLTSDNHPVTYVEGRDATGPVAVLFSVVRRRSMRPILELVKSNHPEVFYSVEDVRMAEDYRPPRVRWISQRGLLEPFYWFRKGK